MKAYCDLHTHSTASDGTDTPEELMAKAQALGLGAIALCDHNTVAGLPAFLAAAKGNILAIPGCEFSVDYEGTELHILGLFIPPAQFPRVTEFLERIVRRKEASNLALTKALCDAGYPIAYEQVKAHGSGTINRVQFALELIRLGYVQDKNEAFRTLLSEEGGLYVPPKRASIWEVLELLTSIGAKPVLAHPMKDLTPAQLENLLPLAKEKGLSGMECYYSEYDAATTQTALDFAGRFGILPSGGSDYHGKNKAHIQLGTGMGDLRVPYVWAENLTP